MEYYFQFKHIYDEAKSQDISTVIDMFDYVLDHKIVDKVTVDFQDKVLHRKYMLKLLRACNEDVYISHRNICLINIPAEINKQCIYSRCIKNICMRLFGL